MSSSYINLEAVKALFPGKKIYQNDKGWNITVSAELQASKAEYLKEMIDSGECTDLEDALSCCCYGTKHAAWARIVATTEIKSEVVPLLTYEHFSRSGHRQKFEKNNVRIFKISKTYVVIEFGFTEKSDGQWLFVEEAALDIYKQLIKSISKDYGAKEVSKSEVFQ